LFPCIKPASPEVQGLRFKVKTRIEQDYNTERTVKGLLEILCFARDHIKKDSTDFNPDEYGD